MFFAGLREYAAATGFHCRLSFHSFRLTQEPGNYQEEMVMNESNIAKLFISYGRADATALADRLAEDFRHHTLQGYGHYEPWKDRAELKGGAPWTDQLVTALRGADGVVAILTPHAVRGRGDPGATTDSVCLDEIAFARFEAYKPIVPVMGIQCIPPFEIFRLDYVDFTNWQDPESYRKSLEKLLVSIAAALRGETRYRSWEQGNRIKRGVAFPVISAGSCRPNRLSSGGL